MPISFQCPSCLVDITLPDQYAGKKARCKECNFKLVVPAAAAEPPAENAATIRFVCSSCQRVLRVPGKFAGRQSKCPGCSNPVTVPATSTGADAAAPPAPSGDPWAIDGAPAPTQAAGAEPFGAAVLAAASGPPDGGIILEGDPRSWRATAAGLMTMWWGSALHLTVYFLAFAILAGLLFLRSRALREFLSPFADDRGVDQSSAIDSGLAFVLLIAFLLMGVAALIGMLLRLIGCIRMLAVPVGKLYAIVILLCELAPFLACGTGVGFSIYSIFDRHADDFATFISSMALTYLASCGSVATAILGLVFLLLFLARIGSILGSKDVVPAVINYVCWLLGGFGFLVLVSIGFYVLVRFLASSADGLPAKGGATTAELVGLLLALVYFVVPLIIWVKYQVMLSTTAAAIRRRAGSVFA
jgi:DNA-directed RNA polymerase subunit RPC12/RpoP